MKRFVSGLIALMLLLSACGSHSKSQSDSVTFYFLQQEFQYGHSGSVLAPESREFSGEPRNLSYWMALYLMGPVEDTHITPVPAGTRILCTSLDNGNIQLELSEPAEKMSDAEFSLACTCLSLTCFSITDADEVTIISGDRKIVLNRKNITLTDDRTFYSQTEETR